MAFMQSSNVKVVLTVNREQRRALDAKFSHLKSLVWLPPVLRRSANYMIESIRLNFEREGRPTKWVSWSARYRAWREKIGDTRKILQLAGKYVPDYAKKRANAKRRGRIKTYSYNLELIRSLLNKDQSLVTKKLGWRIGTNVKYARTHQFGNMRFRIPARPFMMFQDIDVQMIGAMFKQEVERIFHYGVTSSITASKVAI